jgi:hypothetical protein
MPAGAKNPVAHTGGHTLRITQQIPNLVHWFFFGAAMAVAAPETGVLRLA